MGSNRRNIESNDGRPFRSAWQHTRIISRHDDAYFKLLSTYTSYIRVGR
jgi:hypothetical protein